MKLFTSRKYRIIQNISKYTLIFCFIINLILPSFANAAFTAILTSEHVSSTSVKIKATGLTASNSYKIQLTWNESGTIKTLSEAVTATSTGTAEHTFTNLVHKRPYGADIFDANGTTALADQIYFQPLDVATLTTSGVTATSVTAKASGLTASSVYRLELSKQGGTPITKQITATSTGTVENTFSTLTANTTYQVDVFDEPGLIPLANAITVKTLAGAGGGDSGGNDSVTPPGNDSVTPPASTGGISAKIKNPLGSKFPDIPSFIGALLKLVLVVGVPLVALAIIYCGFLFVKALGNPEEITKAKKALMYTLIGAVLLLGAFVLAEAIAGTIKDITNNS
jgi:hypothetical protein